MDDSAAAITCTIPRVKAADLQLHAHASDAWQLASEKLTLSLCRHNVCVLELPLEEQVFVLNAIVKTANLLSLENPVASSLAASEEEAGLVLRPGRHSFNFKPGSSKLECLNSEQSESFQQAYNHLDRLARDSIAAVCRSCHVRLRADTFSPILDDFPLQKGVVSSSTLLSLEHVNNFALRRQLGEKWTLAMSQDGMLNRSLLTLVAVRHPRQGDNPNASKMQVKDALGVWNDVILEPGEVAVMFGQTATQASAGLLRPAVYRMVGELYGSLHEDKILTGRQELTYHLNARPSAILDFHDVLEEAGHFVADRYAQPVCIKDLLQRFDTVLTPPSLFTGARSVQLGTIDVTTAKKRKRISSQHSPASSPVTRSGRVRRGIEGLRADPAHDKPGSSKQVEDDDGDAAQGFAELAQAYRVYVTVDGSTSCPTEFLPIAIAHYKTLNTMWLRAHPLQPCATIFETYCEQLGIELQHVRFLRQDGTRVLGNELLVDLKLKDDEKIIMLPGTTLPGAPCPDGD